jgi:hypothetical protein
LGTAEIAGLYLDLDKLKWAGRFLLCFLLVGHFISWCGDSLSFRGWNVVEKRSRSSYSASALSSVLDAALEGLKESVEEHKSACDFVKNKMNQIDSSKLKDIRVLDMSSLNSAHDHVESTSEAIRKISTEAKKLNHFASFVFYGWFLIVPVTLAILAITAPDSVASYLSSIDQIDVAVSVSPCGAETGPVDQSN